MSLKYPLKAKLRAPGLRAKTVLSESGFLALFAFLLFVLLSLLSPERFLSFRNLQSMGYQMPEFGLLSLSMALIIFSGGINLCVVSSAVLPMVLGALILRNLPADSAMLPVLSCIILVVLVSALCGLLNGYLIAYIKVNSILVTLGSMTLFEGISLNITRGGSLSGFPQRFMQIGNAAFFGVPLVLIFYIVICVWTYILMNWTSFGIRLLSIGSSTKVADFSGISVSRIVLFTYIYASIIAGFAGIILASRYNSIKPGYGSSYLLQSVAAALLGGASIRGGKGSVPGTVWAVLILQMVSNGLNILGVNRYLTTAFMGLILILVVIGFKRTAAGQEK